MRRTWRFAMSLSMPASAVCLLLSSTAAQAQPPRQIPLATQRAREACDAAASRYGYRVLRRDQENLNGSQYQLPMHVSHGSTEADVTCRYDTQRGVADLPQWDARANRVSSVYGDSRVPGRVNRLSEGQLEAQQECQNSINSRAGYHAVRLGTPVAHGARQWDVPVTVRRDGRSTMSVTCRFNTANRRVTLR
jgi:hypothetical protein